MESHASKTLQFFTYPTTSLPEFALHKASLDEDFQENIQRKQINANNEVAYMSIANDFALQFDSLYHADIERTGVGRIKKFGVNLTYSAEKGAIPIGCSRKIHPGGILNEFIWIVQGHTNVKDLQALGSKFWDRWANEEGDIGPMYGAMMREYPNSLDDGVIDQLASVQDTLVNDPHSTRHCITLFNPSFVPPAGKRTYEENVFEGYGALAICHGMALQFHTEFKKNGEKILHLSHTQRSCDFMVGGAVNMPFYSVLLQVMAHCTGYQPGNVHWTINDCHIYKDQVSSLHAHLTQWLSLQQSSFADTARSVLFNQKLVINPDLKDITKITRDDIAIIWYNHLSHVEYPCAA